MELVYKISVVGFDNAPHKEDFYRRFLAAGGPEGLFAEARKLIAKEVENQHRGQPTRGRAPQEMPGWEYVGCLGNWKTGSVYRANEHCLEVMKDPNGRYFLVDQSEHGDYSGHSEDSIVICEVPPS